MEEEERKEEDKEEEEEEEEGERSQQGHFRDKMADGTGSAGVRYLDRLVQGHRLDELDKLSETLAEMSAKLEEIERALDLYLETKRHAFPRFYFLSNDDLLEILGQSRNPAAVQPHLKKCFDNIKSLHLAKVGASSSKWEANGMFSADGEFVQFIQPVSAGQAVESLARHPVERWMVGEVSPTTFGGMVLSNGTQSQDFDE
ncbi:hypothetical protein CRUP_022559 [Coryphaenoides rupestris]|nr:hypothetical protein CRUP_022559 [Coryphaenoides rupestris]